MCYQVRYHHDLPLSYYTQRSGFVVCGRDKILFESRKIPTPACPNGRGQGKMLENRAESHVSTARFDGQVFLDRQYEYYSSRAITVIHVSGEKFTFSGASPGRGSKFRHPSASVSGQKSVDSYSGLIRYVTASRTAPSVMAI